MRGHDLRLTVPALAAWLAAGVLIGMPPAAAGVVAAICALGATVALSGCWARPAVFVIGATLACVSASSAGTGLRLLAVGSGPVRSLAVQESRATVEAVATADPQAIITRSGAATLIRVRVESVRHRARTVRVRVPALALAPAPVSRPGPRVAGAPAGVARQGWRAVVPGQRLRFGARLTPPRRGELLAAMTIVRSPPVVVGEPSRVQRAAARLRERLRAATDGLPATQSAVLPGMVVGDTSRMDSRLADDFRTAGLTHLLVVSGANLSLLLAAVLGACRLIGIGRLRAPPLAGVAVVFFVVVARPEPSVLRAAVMGTIGLFALLDGREGRGVPSLSAAVLLLVMLDPGLARSYGFALSVIATAGLLVLAPPWRGRLARWLPDALAGLLAVALAAQVACAPILVLLAGNVSLIAVPANLLVAPAVPLVVLLGTLAAAVAPFTLGLARVLAWPAGLGVGWIAEVARTAAAMPYATVPWRAGPPGAALLLAAGAAVVLVMRHRRLRLAVLTGAVVVVVTTITVRALAPGWPPRGWQLVACDVGQGDALVLAAGPGSAVVVDAGPDPAAVDRCLDRLRVRSVPVLVLTHPHADHTSGLAGVRDGRVLGAVLTASGGGPLGRAAMAGQRWTVADLTLSVIGPPPGAAAISPRTDTGTVVNNSSLVLIARRPGFSALLPGDIETEAQRSLAPVIPPVQVIKVPHHGSRRQDPAFLAAARATISLTSVGAGNDYGHPAPATLDLLHRLRTRSYRTDRDGDIAIVRTPRGLAVRTRH